MLMLKDDEFDNLYHKKRTPIDSLFQSLEAERFACSGLNEDTWKRKLMIICSLIFGVVFLFDAGKFKYNETNMESVRFTMNRKFEID